MKALVVYDSFFGNTEKVAQAIAAGLGAEAVRVSDFRADRLQGLDLLVIGAPTRGFRPSPLVKDLLKALPTRSLSGIKVAAFDTRIALADVKSRILPPLVKLFGYAAEPIGRAMAKAGGALIVPPEGFIVKDTEGPLKDGELERATAWAARLAAEARR